MKTHTTQTMLLLLGRSRADAHFITTLHDTVQNTCFALVILSKPCVWNLFAAALWWWSGTYQWVNLCGDRVGFRPMREALQSDSDQWVKICGDEVGLWPMIEALWWWSGTLTNGWSSLVTEWDSDQWEKLCSQTLTNEKSSVVTEWYSEQWVKLCSQTLTNEWILKSRTSSIQQFCDTVLKFAFH